MKVHGNRGDDDNNNQNSLYSSSIHNFRNQ